MKILAAFLIFAGFGLAQTPGEIITFDKADAEHCKVITVGGRPLLQSTYDGISVAIAIPMNRGNGDFSIFVAISSTQTVQVNPKDFYGLYSDANHTRFTFYDKAADMEAAAQTQGANGGLSAEKAQVDPGSLGPGVVGLGPGGAPPGGAPPDAGMSGASSPNMSTAYLRKSKVKPGAGVVGWITLRQPKGGKLEVHPTDMLDEVDILVSGILFRF